MSIITSNSPGAITLTSSNDNVVDITGTTADVQGLGISTITINQAETANFNAATATFSVTVAKPDPNVIDTDGDGVVDANDFIIDDDRIWSTSQFRFDTDAWGLTFSKNKSSNGQLDEFYGNAATGYITPELDSSPIGWSSEITWKARTDANWITLTQSLGSVVELERGNDGIKNVNTKGNKATFNIAENNTGNDRDAYIYIDYYYENKFIFTGKEKIEQITTKIISKLSDNTPLPTTPDSTINTNQLINSGNKNTSPTRFDITLSSSTGTVKFYRNAYQTSDRFVVIMDNEIKLDTGNTTGSFTHDLTKTTSATEAQVIVYSNEPSNSGWQFELSDVGKNVELVGATAISVTEAIANQTVSKGAYAFELISGWVQKPNVSRTQNVPAYPNISSRFAEGNEYLDPIYLGYAWDLKTNGYYPQRPSYFKKSLLYVSELATWRQGNYSFFDYSEAGFVVLMTGSQTIKIKFYVNSGLTKFYTNNSDFVIVDENNTSVNSSGISLDASDGFEKITTLTITSPSVGVNGNTILYIAPQLWSPTGGKYMGTKRSNSGFGEIHFQRTPINTFKDFVGVPITGLNSYT